LRHNIACGLGKIQLWSKEIVGDMTPAAALRIGKPRKASKNASSPRWVEDLAMVQQT
jgi:hypothetical protein